MTRAKSWKPRLRARGKIYCSPACGAGCTRKEFNTATREAKRLAKRLGAGWEPEVTENAGWHWRVKRGAFSMRFAPALCGLDHAYWCTCTQWGWAICYTETAGTPEAAFAACAKSVRDRATQMLAALEPPTVTKPERK